MPQVKDQRRIIYTINKFTSINKKVKQEILPKDIGYTFINGRYDVEFGSISKRRNRAKYGDMTTLGTSKITSLFRYYKNSDATKKFIISYDTTLKVGDDAAGTFSNIKTGLTADEIYEFLTYKDMCYITNGADNNQFYDGTNNEDMGVPVATAPTLATGAAGVLTGAYKYKVLYQLDDYQDGSSSVASAEVNPSAQKVTVTIPTSSNSRCTDRKIYRTKAGGSVYYELTTVADNTTTSYSDNTPDSDLGTTQAPTDYGAPASYRHILLHKERVHLARNATLKSRIIFSDIRSGTSYPDVFPANNFLDIGKDDGDEITFILEDAAGQYVVGKQNSIRIVHTDSDNPSGWAISGVMSVQGCIGRRSSVSTPWGIFYLTKYGEGRKRIMLFNGSNSEPKFEEIEPILTGILDSSLNRVDFTYHNGSLHIAYTDNSAGDAFNNRELVIDLLNGTYVVNKKNIAGYASWNSGTDNGELYTGTSDATGFCYREDAENYDVDITLKSEIDGGTFGTYAESGGTEAAPTLIFKSNITSHTSLGLVSAGSGTVEDLTGDEDTASPSCVYTSPVLEINALTLTNLFWNETLGSYGDIWFYVRTGNTEALCEAASWNGPYSDPTGSDISGVTAGVYIQYKVRMFITTAQVANYAQVYLSKGTDYVVRIGAGKGVEAETSIDFDWISGWNDFSDLGDNFKRTRKRMRAVKINFERTTASGTLEFSYYLDGSSTVSETVSIALATYASQGYYVHFFPLGVNPTKFKYRLYNADAYDITIKSLEFTISPLPIYSLI